MNAENDDRMVRLLKQALPPLADAEPKYDLWQAMLSRMHTRASEPPWFDWALACGVAVFALAVPAAVPVLLFYL